MISFSSAVCLSQPASKPTNVDVLTNPTPKIGGSAKLGLTQNLVEILVLNSCLLLHWLYPGNYQVKKHG